MSRDAMNWAWSLCIPKNAKWVLVRLADRVHEGGCTAWPSVYSIAQDVCLSGRSVQYGLKWLEDHKLISRQCSRDRKTPTYTLAIGSKPIVGGAAGAPGGASLAPRGAHGAGKGAPAAPKYTKNSPLNDPSNGTASHEADARELAEEEFDEGLGSGLIDDDPFVTAPSCSKQAREFRAPPAADPDPWGIAAACRREVDPPADLARHLQAIADYLPIEPRALNWAAAIGWIRDRLHCSHAIENALDIIIAKSGCPPNLQSLEYFEKAVRREAEYVEHLADEPHWLSIFADIAAAEPAIPSTAAVGD